jgi:hypothetical protein
MDLFQVRPAVTCAGFTAYSWPGASFRLRGRFINSKYYKMYGLNKERNYSREI